MAETVRQEIEAALRAGLAPEALTVVDESHLHAGHAGAKERGGGHYRVTAVAACFGGMPLVARHRKVYALMGDRMRAEVHALALDLRARGSNETSRAVLGPGEV